MMLKLKIGLVGASQLSFPGDKEAAFRRGAEDLRHLSGELGFDLVVHPDTIITREDALRAVAGMEAAGIDFLLVQHTSYAAGELAPVLAGIRGVHVGFWAIPEGAADGAVPYNSLCSINMHMGIVAYYLRDRGIRIKWFYGTAEDAEFRRRLQITVCALTALKNLRRARVALVGGVAPGFNDLYDDERRLLRRFDGLYVNRLHEYGEIKERALAVPDAEAARVAAAMEAASCGYADEAARRTLLVAARVYLAYRAFIDENRYDAVAISCWPKFQDDFQYSVCSVIGQLNDEGTVAACEGDLLSAVSMLALRYLSGEDIPTLMDLSAFDEEDESVLLWHCGPAASRYCRGGGYRLGCNYSGMAHEPGKGVTARCGVVRDMVFDEGPFSAMRLTGECDRLFQMGGWFMPAGKPSFHGSRGWCHRLTYAGEAIGARDLLNTILCNGFQHHFPLVAGDYTEEIQEFAAWLGLRPLPRVPYAAHLQVVDDGKAE